MEFITLTELLRRHWPDYSVPQRGAGVGDVETLRARELWLRQLLPAALVRRIDSCFARSNTTHPETGRALYTICRASQARRVFETGTYWGYSTTYLAAAVEHWEDGRVWTFDLHPQAGRHIPRRFGPRIEVHRGKPSTESLPAVLRQVTPDLFFQDSRHDYAGVVEELQLVVPVMKSGSVCLFHDFVVPDVRRAVADLLPGRLSYVLESGDPQQLGVVIL